LGGLGLVAHTVVARQMPFNELKLTLLAYSPLMTLTLAARFLDGNYFGLFRFILTLLLAGGVYLLAHPAILFCVHAAAAASSSNSTTNTANITSFGVVAAAEESSCSISGGDLAKVLAIALFEPLFYAGLFLPVLDGLLALAMQQKSTTGSQKIHPTVFVFWLAVGGQLISVIGMTGLLFPIRGGSSMGQKTRGGGGGMFAGWNLAALGSVQLAALFDTAANLLLAAGLRWMDPVQLMLVRSCGVMLLEYMSEVHFFLVSHDRDLNPAPPPLTPSNSLYLYPRHSGPTPS
jgi:hypothetical protein